MAAATKSSEVEWIEGAGSPGRPSYLYRYVSLVQCLNVLQKGHLVLVDPASWPDKYEGAFSKAIFENEPEFIRANVRAICFSADAASYALWKIFGDPKPVVRLRFRVSELTKALTAYTSDAAKTFFVRVNYRTKSEIDNELKGLHLVGRNRKARDAARFVGMKRAIYSYEQEYRVVRVTRSNIGSKPIYIPIVPSKVIDQFKIDPYISPRDVETVKSTLLMTYGSLVDISQSVHDQDP